MVYSAKSDATGTISQFTRRKNITITTAGASTPANYQVKVTVAYEPEMQADFDDIRFNTKAGTYIDYWIESKTDSVTADVWLELPDAITDPGSDIIWMYYGNAGLSSGSNGANTFEFFDLTQYTETDPNLKYTVTSNSTTNKVDVVGETTGAATVYKTIPATENFIFDYEYYTGSGTSWSTAVLLADTSAAGMTDAGWGSNNAVGVWMNPTSAIPLKFVNGVRTLGTDPNNLVTSTLYYVTVKRVGTTLTLSVFSDIARTQNVLNYPLTLSVASTTYNNIHIANNHINQVGGRTYYIQNFYSRKYASPEPTTSVGTAQHQRGVPVFLS